MENGRKLVGIAFVEAVEIGLRGHLDGVEIVDHLGLLQFALCNIHPGPDRTPGDYLRKISCIVLLPMISRTSVRLTIICICLSSDPTIFCASTRNLSESPSKAAQFLNSTIRIRSKSSRPVESPVSRRSDRISPSVFA